jgi:hypothetical protein
LKSLIECFFLRDLEESSFQVPFTHGQLFPNIPHLRTRDVEVF